MEGGMTMTEPVLGTGYLVLGTRSWVLGTMVMRPTVMGERFSWERRAQSSSSTSIAETRNRLESAAIAASRAAGDAKKTRIVSSRSSTAVGEKSSTAARRRSG